MALRLWLRHGRLIALAALLVAVFLFSIGLRLTGSARATSGGDPYTVPVVVDSNPDPNIVETTIIAEEATVDVGQGVQAHVQTFNGQVPGPEFHLKVGDTVIVHFENHLSKPTGIHWHGIELNNASDGTPLTQDQVPANGKFLYKFKVTRPGIYWYHPHHHSSTNQVFKGLYGPIIITDPYDAALQAAGKLPSPAQTVTLALSDLTVCKAAGTNDAATYDPSLPWVGGPSLPAQAGPTPRSLCETSPIDEDGASRPPFAAGDVPNIQSASTSGRTNEGQTVLTNGINVGGRAGSPSAPGALAPGAATFNVQAGQGLRLRVGNTATIRFFRLRLTDNAGTQIPLIRVGGQGGLLDHAVEEGGMPGGFDTLVDSGEILLDPGDRADLVAAIPASATGVLTLWTEDSKRTGMGYSNIPSVPVMHLNVTGSAGSVYTIAGGTPLRASIPGAAVEVLGAPTDVLLDPSTFSPPKLGMASQDIQLTTTGAAVGINNVFGTHDFPGSYTTAPHLDSTRYAKLGETLELTVTNMTQAHHPFHLHGFSIQPIELTRPGHPTYTFPEHEFRDNIDVPGFLQGESAPGYSLRFRVRLDDRTLMDGTTMGGGLGRWVFHCHIFFHATFGMISEFVVSAPDGNERPNVNSNTTSVEVNEGQTATVHGTYHDPDGDAVTLSASLGTVTDNGGGSFTWHHATTDGPDESGFVYVTATDSGGHASQVAFGLKVNNLPPTVAITSPANGAIVQLADPVNVTAPFTDPGTGDTHTCSINWGDSTTSAGTVVEASGSGTCTGSHTYASGGPKTITATVTDDDGGAGANSVSIVVNSPPNCNPVRPNPKFLWPPNHKFVLITLAGATDPDGDVVTLTITGVTQDEPLNGQGDGDTSPDGKLVPGHSDQVQLRAERSGRGDGRVYRISFGGSDGKGGTCSATKKVLVVHDQAHGTAIDSGLIVNSLF